MQKIKYEVNENMSRKKISIKRRIDRNENIIMM